MVEVLRTRHYSRGTEQAYIHWIRRFILFHAPSHPRRLTGGDVNRFLSHLAIKENVAAFTQNQALGAVLFLYEQPRRHAREGRPLAGERGVRRHDHAFAAMLTEQVVAEGGQA